MNNRDKIIKQIDNLKHAIINGKNVAELEIDLGTYNGYLYDFRRRFIDRCRKNGEIDDELVNSYDIAYKLCKHNNSKHENEISIGSSSNNLVYIDNQDAIYINDVNIEDESEDVNILDDVSDTSQESQYDNTNKLEKLVIVRDESSDTSIENKTIIEYIANISHNNQEYSIILSRKDMEDIHRIYSSEGENLSQKAISRHFPELDRRLIKKMLNALGVTKASAPFPQHVIEENNVDALLTMANNMKERSFFHKIDTERIKNLEKRNIELINQFNKLKSKQTFVSNINTKDIIPYTPTNIASNKKCLFLYISDCHVGAYVDSRSIYSNNYNKEEFYNRLNKIVDLVNDLSRTHNFDKIIVCNLGDSIDGFDAKTTRGGHTMPQNMDNKEQVEVFITGMLSLFENLYKLNVTNRIDYICVGDSNHDGDSGWVANIALEAFLKSKYPHMETQIFKKFIGVCNYGRHTFLLTHGKDAKDMFKNMPLNINEKTENFIGEYIDNLKDVRNNVHVIKGDLHQSSTNYTNKFRYKNVASLFGSSKWIHMNFGNTKAALDYDIVDTDSDIVLSGRIVLN